MHHVLHYRVLPRGTTFSQFSHSVESNSLRPHESQHARPPCPSPTPGVYSDSCPSSRWCHPAISSSVVLFSSCPQSLPALGSFPMSQLFSWGGQSTGVSASASVLPVNTRTNLLWMDWLDLLAVQGTLRSLLQHHSSKASIFSALSFLHSPTLTSIHDHFSITLFNMPEEQLTNSISFYPFCLMYGWR